MNIKIAMLLLCLAGCGSGGGGSKATAVDTNNHGYGFAYDVQGAAGMKLRYTPILTAADPLSNPVFLENIYTQVEECTGVSAPDPFVILLPQGSLPNGWFGETLNTPSLVLIGSVPMSLNVPRHEFIHYLLFVETGDGDATHTSKFFLDRAAGGCA
jgi:hypothetical protein